MNRIALPALAAVFALAALLIAPPGAAQTPDGDAPVVVSQYPEDGQTFDRQIPFMQLCFEEPINILDLDLGGDFDFRVFRPDERPIAHVAHFQGDAYGIVIERMSQVEEPEGQWRFEWRVTNPDATAATSGTINFSVDLSDGQTPQAEPNPCVGPQGTAAPRSTTSAPRTPDTPNPDDVTPTPAATATPADPDDDGGNDTVLIVIILLAVAGGAALLAALVWLRSRRGGAGAGPSA